MKTQHSRIKDLETVTIEFFISVMLWLYLPDCWYYLPKWQFRFRFCAFLYVFLILLILTAFPVCVRFLDFTTTIMLFGEKYKLTRLSLCKFL